MAKIKLKVDGMHCKSCGILIKDSLSELEGIKQTNVNHKSGTVEVEFDGSKTKKEEIIELIKREGYKVRR